jgi:hypothetical protein
MITRSEDSSLQITAIIYNREGYERRAIVIADRGYRLATSSGIGKPHVVVHGLAITTGLVGHGLAKSAFGGDRDSCHRRIF